MSDSCRVCTTMQRAVYVTSCACDLDRYLEVTHDISKYCKAKVFDSIGKSKQDQDMTSFL